MMVVARLTSKILILWIFQRSFGISPPLSQNFRSIFTSLLLISRADSATSTPTLLLLFKRKICATQIFTYFHLIFFHLHYFWIFLNLKIRCHQPLFTIPQPLKPSFPLPNFLPFKIIGKSPNFFLEHIFFFSLSPVLTLLNFLDFLLPKFSAASLQIDSFFDLFFRVRWWNYGWLFYGDNFEFVGLSGSWD